MFNVFLVGNNTQKNFDVFDVIKSLFFTDLEEQNMLLTLGSVLKKIKHF